MKQIILIFFIALLGMTPHVFACTNDMDCDDGQICVQPAGSIGFDGICVTQTNPYGVPQSPIPPTATPHKVPACQFDTDCNMGYQCIKQDGQIYGICLK